MIILYQIIYLNKYWKAHLDKWIEPALEGSFTKT